MLGLGYHPEHYKGSMKQPIFQTSTYEFPNAQAGKDFFSWATGKEEMPEGATMGNIYGRLGSPNTQLLEQRLAYLDNAEQAVVFGSGMAAIASTLLDLAKPGQVLLHTNPVYGGTHSFFTHYLAQYEVITHPVDGRLSAEEVVEQVQQLYPGKTICAFFTETPANPTMDLYSIRKARVIAEAFSSEAHAVPVVVDNTYMGPLMCSPLALGAHLVVYSATKNLGGHSDVIAGAVTGLDPWISGVRRARTFIGGILGPMDSWLLLRSLETYQLRVHAQQASTHLVARAIESHPATKEVRYLGNVEEWNPSAAGLVNEEYKGTGSMIALHIKGGEAEAFKVLDALNVFKLGVSLGSTESLAEHPHSMTHGKIDDALKLEIGITDNLIRLSIGVENPHDLIADCNKRWT